MGLVDAVKEKAEEEERKLIRDIVKELPLVPDQVRVNTKQGRNCCRVTGK